MTDNLPALKLLHPEAALVAGKLAIFEKLPTETILASLLPGRENSLRTRTDGTILEGNHRIHILRRRGVDVDKLPREMVARDEL
jgi:hypothetical protein